MTFSACNDEVDAMLGESPQLQLDPVASPLPRAIEERPTQPCRGQAARVTCSWRGEAMILYKDLLTKP